MPHGPRSRPASPKFGGWLYHPRDQLMNDLAPPGDPANLSFLIRLTRDADGRQWQVQVNPLPGQEKRLFPTLEAAFFYIETLMRPASSPDGADSKKIRRT